MFESIVKTFKGPPVFTASERLDEYRLIVEGVNADPATALDWALALLTSAHILPTRDSLELHVTFDHDSISVSDTTLASQNAISTHLGQHTDSGSVKLELIIRKGNASTVSLYSAVAFGRYLATESLVTTLSAFNKRFNERLDFECFCPLNEGGSETIRFWSPGRRPADPIDTHRLRTLTTFRDNSFCAGFLNDLIASDFYLLHSTDDAVINAFMNKASALLCSIYIANNSQVASPGTLSYQLIGYKAIEGTVLFDDLTPALAGLYKIYDWAYGAGGSSDRIGLARNVLSLHTERLQDVKDDSPLWSAILSNYQIYLKRNVDSYLEIKNKISEFLIESTGKTYSLVDDLIDSLKNSVLVLLTFLLTVVVISAFKDTDASVIFSLPYVWIVVVLCMALTVWIVGTSGSLIRRFDNSMETTRSILDLGYGKIIISSEISESVEPIKTRNRAYLVKQCRRYTYCWFGVAAFLIVGFIAGHFITAHSSKSVVVLNQPSAQPVIPPNVSNREHTIPAIPTLHPPSTRITN